MPLLNPRRWGQGSTTTTGSVEEMLLSNYRRQNHGGIATTSGVEKMSLHNSRSQHYGAVTTTSNFAKDQVMVYNCYIWCAAFMKWSSFETVALHAVLIKLLSNLCYSALIAFGPLLLSPPSLPTFAHTLVSGIMCATYASRNSHLQVVWKFTYGNLPAHYISLHFAILC